MQVQTGKLETIAMQYLSHAEKAKVYAELLIRLQVKTTAASKLSDSRRDPSLLWRIQLATEHLGFTCSIGSCGVDGV
ncbi:hypothetical protein SLE2022_225760 [Rubroshorea leprosula]